MLTHTRVFSSFSVDKLDSARRFYAQTLGLEVKELPMGLLELVINEDYSVMVYPKPDHEAAGFTVLNFVVTDIDRAVDDLRKKGVVFEQYSGAIQTDEKGISRSRNKEQEPDIAWFKDPAGNILSVLTEA